MINLNINLLTLIRLDLCNHWIDFLLHSWCSDGDSWRSHNHKHTHEMFSSQAQTDEMHDKWNQRVKRSELSQAVYNNHLPDSSSVWGNKRNTWISSQMTLNRNSWALFPSHMITSDLRRVAWSFQESYQRRRWYRQGPHRRLQLIHSGHRTVSAVCCQRLDLDLKFLPMFLLTLRLARRTERFDLRSWWVVLREIIFTNES